MEIRPITSSEARTVRLPVLRAGLPPESAIMDHDDDPGTRHFGAFFGSRLVGVATFFAESCPLRPGPQRARLGEERRDADKPGAVERTEVPRAGVVVVIEDRGFGR